MKCRFERGRIRILFGETLRALLAGLGLVLTLTAGSVALAQGELDDSRVEPVRERLVAVFDAAREENLPGDWLRDKVAEGLAKGAPAVGIARATEALLGWMRAAQTIYAAVRLQSGGALALGSRRRDATPRTLRALVDALANGTVPGALEDIAQAAARGAPRAPFEAVRLAATTVAELCERGFSSKASTTAVAQVIERSGPSALGRFLVRAAKLQQRLPSGQGDRALRDRELWKLAEGVQALGEVSATTGDLVSADHALPSGESSPAPGDPGLPSDGATR